MDILSRFMHYSVKSPSPPYPMDSGALDQACLLNKAIPRYVVRFRASKHHFCSPPPVAIQSFFSSHWTFTNHQCRLFQSYIDSIVKLNNNPPWVTELAPVVQTLDRLPTEYITIQLINISEINCVIQWIEIYQADSIIHILNNCGVALIISPSDYDYVSPQPIQPPWTSRQKQGYDLCFCSCTMPVQFKMASKANLRLNPY